MYRKVQEAGLQQRYQADADFSLAVKMLLAIAFCPVADVVDAFETLAEDIGDDYQGLLDYFEDTYIGRPDRRQRRDPNSVMTCGMSISVHYKSYLELTTTSRDGAMVFNPSSVPVIQTSGLSLES